MKEIKKIVCNQCSISAKRHSIVMGRGSIPADIMFLGEAPGESEDMLGKAFIGRAGKLLDIMISTACTLIHIPTSPTFYIANTLLCRPYIEDKNSPDYLRNREPTKEEVLRCQKNVLNIYRLVNPKIVVFIGNVAEKYYKNQFTYSDKIRHPAALLREGGESSPYFLTNVRKLSNVFLSLKEE